MADVASMALAVAGSATASALLTAAALAYARRRALLDLPGRRRSHAVPTPRGGGVGPVAVIAAVVLMLGLGGGIALQTALAFAGGLLAVAAIGWIDDHRPLSARLRLAVHLLAALGLALATATGSQGLALPPWLLATAAVLCLVGAVNVWNFMDGIDGLVASQSAWVATCVMLAFAVSGQWPWALLSACVAAAALGFLPFNFPRATIFMGDVGSGGLGFACGALLLGAVLQRALDPWSAVLVASALLFDAALTLAHRMRLRRHWYSAHREHLYQWLVRSGLGHARTTMLYLGWNLLVALPLLLWARAMPALAPVLALLAATVAASLWYGGKRAMIRRLGSSI
jgi:UDP-N-acetylmuramyl pentapeptide phosphotransferase/UDP-N-acetylglucosamine-1-phosphate transferase